MNRKKFRWLMSLLSLCCLVLGLIVGSLYEGILSDDKEEMTFANGRFRLMNQAEFATWIDEEIKT